MISKIPYSWQPINDRWIDKVVNIRLVICNN